MSEPTEAMIGAGKGALLTMLRAPAHNGEPLNYELTVKRVYDAMQDARTPASCSPDVAARIAAAIGESLDLSPELKIDMQHDGEFVKAARAAIAEMGIESMMRREDAMRAKVLSYDHAHEDAVEMGYPSLTEALEHLEELRNGATG